MTREYSGVDYVQECLYGDTVQPVHRGVLPVLVGDLRASEVQIVVDHVQGTVAEYLSQGEDITTIQQVIDGEGMPAQVRMQSFHA